MQQRGEAHGAAAREVVAERLGQQRAHRAGVLAERLRARLQPGDRVEHLERVAVDVAVVEDVLLDAAQRGELRQHDGGDAEVLGEDQAVGGALGAHDPLELGEHALGRHRGEPGRAAAHRLARLRLELEVELDREARRAQGAQRVVGERRRRDHAQPPRLQIGPPAVGVEQLAACERLGHRVDREVAGGEVGGEVVVAQPHEIDVPGTASRRALVTASLAPADDPPGPERARELERRPARRPRDRAGGRARVARDRDVEVAGRAPEQPVPERAADEPGRLAGERRAGGLQRIPRGGLPAP